MNNNEIGWNFDDSYRRLPKAFYSNVNPNPVKAPELVLFNDELAESLGLNGEALKREEGVSILSGNAFPDATFPLAQAYAGHQFGHFTMLGDGRAALLGEQITPDGERYDIQLKGSGRTLYSRGGDGRAALGPMLREYIISEAMHALGIPTTRSLAVVTTGESIFREKMLPGAILTRVAKSHLRVGTFQYGAGRQEKEELKELADYAIKRHVPEIDGEDEKYLRFLQEIIKRQASLIAKWQLVGFIHGVMNTDNMTISGETIDYGPCAFMDVYDPKTVFSSIDHQGRYAYVNQPIIGGWNLARFAETLLPLLDEDEKKAVDIAQKEISQYQGLFDEYWLSGMRGKLGIFNEEPDDGKFIQELLSLMEKYRADYTNTFRNLTLGETTDGELFQSEEFSQWLKWWEGRLERQPESKDLSVQLMKKQNPAIIPRNHRVEEALNAAVESNDLSLTKKLLVALSKPYAYSKEQVEYCEPPKPTNTPYKTFCGT